MKWKPYSEMTPEEKAQMMEAGKRCLESWKNEVRYVVVDPDGAVHGMSSSQYEAMQKQKQRNESKGKQRTLAGEEVAE